jgi:hypothetical protein
MDARKALWEKGGRAKGGNEVLHPAIYEIWKINFICAPRALDSPPKYLPKVGCFAQPLSYDVWRALEEKSHMWD